MKMLISATEMAQIEGGGEGTHGDFRDGVSLQFTASSRIAIFGVHTCTLKIISYVQFVTKY